MIRLLRGIAAAIFFLFASALFLHAGGDSPFLLTRDGRAACVILTAESPSPVVADAVAELNYWVGRIAGARLPVLSEKEWDGSTPYIAVGPCELARSNGWDAPPFAQEEARLFIGATRIGLLGNDHSPYRDVEWRGTYYAVNEFVRRSLEVTWIWPGPSGEVFAARPTIAAQPAQWKWKPTILLNRTLRNGYRILRSKEQMETMLATLQVPRAEWQQLSDEHDQWLKRERMNKSSNARFGHAFHDWWALYSSDHPDWFARPPEGVPQLGGIGVKLNLSNPEVQDKIFDDWKAAWQADPINNLSLNVAPNDSRGFDTRPETRAWDAARNRAFSDKEIFNGSQPVLSDRYVHFWNLLARRIRAVSPEARLTTYAYRNYRTPPLDSERLEENVIICYVGGEGYYPDERFILDEWMQWRGLGATLCWRPNLLNSGHGTPYQYSRQLYDDFATLQRNGLMGSDFDALVGSWAGNGLTYYVLAEQHSRPEAAYDDLAGEYFAAFGPAREAIRQYHEDAEAISRKGPELLRTHHLVSNPTWGGWWKAYIRLIPILFTQEALARLDESLKVAEKAVHDSGTSAERERVALIRRGWEHTGLMAEAFGRLGLQDPKRDIHDSEKSREALLPLWKFRLNHLVDLAFPTVTLFMEEQRQLGLWSDFVSPDAPPSQIRIPLREGWTARLDQGNHGLAAGWARGLADAAPVEVGMPWRRALPGSGNSHIIWYAAPLHVPVLPDTGETVALRFGSVDSEMKLWINNQLVTERGYPHAGNYDSWNEAFTVDISRWVKAGATNTLVLRVESESLNAGITGPVFLLLGQ